MIPSSGKECPATESECQTTCYIGSRLFILNNTERNLSTENKQILEDFITMLYFFFFCRPRKVTADCSDACCHFYVNLGQFQLVSHPIKVFVVVALVFVVVL